MKVAGMSKLKLLVPRAASTARKTPSSRSEEDLQGGRGHRDPLRGAARRSRDAGDARPRRHDRRWAGAALITDGRFSGATCGFCIGHVGPEAAVGGPIALLQNGDIIEIDAEVGTLNVKLTDAELAERKPRAPRQTNHTSGALWKYAQQVGPAVDGAVTHPGGAHEKQCYADI